MGYSPPMSHAQRTRTWVQNPKLFTNTLIEANPITCTMLVNPKPQQMKLLNELHLSAFSSLASLPPRAPLPHVACDRHFPSQLRLFRLCVLTHYRQPGFCRQGHL